MKTTEKNLDEIIFEKRNKAYGAYMLRKVYNKNLIRAMVIAFTMFLTGVSIPLIASYMNEDRNISVDRMIDSVIIRTVETKTDIKLPDAPKPKVERIPSFTAPKVVANPDSALENFTDLIDMTKNRNISDTNTGISDGGNDHPKDQVMPDDDTNTPPPTIVQEMPEFPGGDVARISFFASNIKYPMIARETGVQGQVYFTFVVEKDGSISGLKLLRGIGAGCDDEAERVIAMMPKWKPGRQNGKEVRVQFNMPISFILK